MSADLGWSVDPLDGTTNLPTVSDVERHAGAGAQRKRVHSILSQVQRTEEHSLYEELINRIKVGQRHGRPLGKIRRA